MEGGELDPTNGGLYCYAGNNPVRYTDPDGRSDIDSFSSQEDTIKAVSDYITKNYKGNEFSGVIIENKNENGIFYTYKIQEGGPKSVVDGSFLLMPLEKPVVKFHSHPSQRKTLRDAAELAAKREGGKLIDVNEACTKEDYGFLYKIEFSIDCSNKELGIKFIISNTYKIMTKPSKEDLKNKRPGVMEILFVPDISDYFIY